MVPSNFSYQVYCRPIRALAHGQPGAWLAPNGQARVQVLPKGDPDDTAVLREFVAAVLAVEPAATGPAVMLYEAGNTILRAFIEAGAFALAAIFVLLPLIARPNT